MSSIENPDDAGLLRRLRAGDDDAFRELYAAHAPRLLRLLQRMLGDRALAEDVVQETFIAIFQSVGSYRGEARLSTWITSIGLRRAQNAQRGRERRKESPDEAALGAQPTAPGPDAALTGGCASTPDCSGLLHDYLAA